MKKDLLKKMKMPSEARDPMLELGEEELDLAEMEGEAEGSMGEEEMLAEEEAPVNEALAAMEDQDLADELERRGWMVSKPEAEAEEAEAEMEAEDSEEELA